MINKGTAVFKHKPEDFIVEEVWGDEVCKVSESPTELENAKVDLGKLDVNDRRDFIICELEKLNIDHFFVVGILGQALRVGEIGIGYAGTKDKAAWTCQKISIYDPHIELLKNFSHSGIKLKNFRWGKHKIKTGDLTGNRFRIVLRDADREAIKVLSRLRNTSKLPNLFGEQRFGSLRRDNVKIGKLILKRKFEEAVFAFLTGFGVEEDEEIKNAKKKLREEKNFKEALKYFPDKLRTERRVIEYIVNNPRDWVGALEVIGEKTLLIMCQAVQSQIFNDILEQAIESGIGFNTKTINILGSNSEFSSGRLGAVEKEVMKNNDLYLYDFEVLELPFLNLKSAPRRAFFEVSNLEVETADDEEFSNGKKIILSFVLSPGVYATTFLANFFELR